MAATWTLNHWFQKGDKMCKGCFVFSEANTYMCACFALIELNLI